MKKYKLPVVLLLFSVVLVATFLFLKSEEGQASTSRFNMSYVYFGSSSSYINYVNKTNNSLNVISPSYFDLNPDGSLKLTRTVDRAFIREMQSRNIRVVPFLSNHWDRNIGRAALNNRVKLADEIVKAINDYNLDGVNVDIENVTEIDKDKYTDLVRLLREKLPPHKEVSVAVAANPRGFTRGWHGSYDYRELAKYSDYLMIMAYDESYHGSAPGPVASYSFVEDSIKYALRHAPPEKIVLGIPFYGRYWEKNAEGQYVGGRGVHLTKVEEIMSKHKTIKQYDKGKESPVAYVTVRQGDPQTFVSGRLLAPGEYVFWYENEESIKRKLELVNKYNIKGTGSWSLGQEVDGTWDYFSLWLNGEYFSDIQNHWAQKDILLANSKGYMVGTSKYRFEPNAGLTRAQAATVMVRVLGLNKISSNTTNFSDVREDHWASESIKIARDHGILVGVGNNRFAPDENMTREQMAALLNRVINKDTQIDISKMPNLYKDIKANQWSYKDIIIMSNQGIFSGYDNGNFGPKDIITRAQMAALLNRIEEHLKK